jgi:hypothetical protein
VRRIIDRLKGKGTLTPEQLVDACLDLLGPVEVGSQTRKELVEQARQWGALSWDSDEKTEIATKHATEMMQLIVATREYQFG